MSTNRAKSGDPEECSPSLRWRWRSSSGAEGELVGGSKWVVGDAVEVTGGDHLVELVCTSDIDGEWTAEVVLVFDDDAAMISELRFRPIGGPVPAVDRKTLSRFKLAEMQRKIWRSLPLVLGLVARNGQQVPQFNRPRPGRGGYSDLEVAIWADQYVKALAAAPRRPIAHLVETNPNTNASAWRRWMDIAQQRGLLVDRPPAHSGEGGGRLSRKAEQLLKERKV